MKIRILIIASILSFPPVQAINEKLRASLQTLAHERSQKMQERIPLPEIRDRSQLAARLRKKPEEEEPAVVAEFVKKELSELSLALLPLFTHYLAVPSFADPVRDRAQPIGQDGVIHPTRKELLEYGPMARQVILRKADTHLAHAQEDLEALVKNLNKERGTSYKAAELLKKNLPDEDRAKLNNALREKVTREAFKNEITDYEESAYIKGNIFLLFAYFAAQKAVKDAVLLGMQHGERELTGNEKLVPIFSGTINVATTAAFDHALLDEPLPSGQALVSWMLADATFEGVRRIASWLIKQRKDPIALPIPQALRDRGVDEDVIANGAQTVLEAAKIYIIEPLVVKPYCDQLVGGLVKILRDQDILGPAVSQEPVARRPLFGWT